MTKERILNNHTAIPYCGCWIWNNCLVSTERGHGYGAVWFQGKLHRAHRLMYEFRNGPIPKDLHVCHHCDEPSCVNPDHLFLGTPEENASNKVSKGRQARGSTAGGAKLKRNQVIEIRVLLEKGVYQREIAKQFGVCRTAISLIKTGHRWGWLQEEVS